MRRAFPILAFVALAACAGSRARTDVLLPAMRMAWETSIAATVDNGIGGSLSRGELTEVQAIGLRNHASSLASALKRGDKAGLAASDWPGLQPQAVASIARRREAGALGENAAALMLAEVVNFGDAYAKAVAR